MWIDVTPRSTRWSTPVATPDSSFVPLSVKARYFPFFVMPFFSPIEKSLI